MFRCESPTARLRQRSQWQRQSGDLIMRHIKHPRWFNFTTHKQILLCVLLQSTVIVVFVEFFVQVITNRAWKNRLRFSLHKQHDNNNNHRSTWILGFAVESNTLLWEETDCKTKEFNRTSSYKRRRVSLHLKSCCYSDTQRPPTDERSSMVRYSRWEVSLSWILVSLSLTVVVSITMTTAVVPPTSNWIRPNNYIGDFKGSV